ncbi:hypothetical protein [Lysobacter fragariae]
MSQPMPLAGRRVTPPWQYVLMGGLALGTFDLIFACSFWGALFDVPPIRILQSIAAGVQGDAARQGGIPSAVLGAACHYFIATVMVATYYLASGRWTALVAQPLRHGLAYGAWLYVAMTWIVVPLSNAPQPSKTYLPWTVASILMHLVFGMMCAWFARAARRVRS